ncbi:DNA primase [Clostridium rhizosphaerae]|uniref:DNA primase n=1 Tax=Clostridium rhizosphaerae TaxID=2803861 RepID=UPI001A9C5D08|nr:DNA primase [Clostridium rhizosphaerae]
MIISEEIIQKVKDSNDIVDVISETVRLKRAGKYFAGLCPFHHEKTPSFTVTQDKQIYKCFGCGEGGNVITFIMKNRNLEFAEAVKFLAERANIEIESENPKAVKEKEATQKLYKINVEAARYFFANIKKFKTAAGYFTNRGISENTIRHFGLGFAPDSWNGLMNFLKHKGYTELDMLNAGLIIKNQNNRFYDRFRNRVIFPVFDYKGKVIGFGGRVLDDSKPKYLNSPETNIFKKGTNLYGLNFAIKNLKEKMIIIVEGYMDCISLHQYGVTNVVASLGTALTTYQAKLLKKYVNKVIISYDADLAGQNATIRGLEILKNEGFDIRVLTVPKGKDPDEFIRVNGREAFEKLISGALPLIDYRLKKEKENFNLNNSEELISYAKNAATIISDLDSVTQDIYIKKISEETGIKEQAIYDLISGKIQKNVSKDVVVNIEGDFGQKLYLEPIYMKAERSILKLMHERKEVYDYVRDNFDINDLINQTHKKIFSLICEYTDYDMIERQKHVEAKCTDVESSKEWINILEFDLIYKDNDYIAFVNDCFKELRKYRLEENKKSIISRIKQCEKNNTLEESLQLAKQLVETEKELSKL